MTYNRHTEDHPAWLKTLDHRCQFSGVIAGKSYKGKRRPYNFHHTASSSYKKENITPGWDVLLLTPSYHNFVHMLGGVPPWVRHKVTCQNKMARALLLSWLWRFPNPLQRLFNWCCRLPVPWRVRAIATGLAEFGCGVGVVYLVWAGVSYAT